MAEHKSTQGKTRTDASCGVIPVHLQDRRRGFLLVQHHAGHWGFPKGHPGRGESCLEAARRELAEETGINAVRLLEAPTFQERYFFRARGRLIHKTVTYYIGLVEDPAVTPQAAEVSDFAWGDYEQTRQRLSFKEGKRLLEEADKALDEAGS